MLPRRRFDEVSLGSPSWLATFKGWRIRPHQVSRRNRNGRINLQQVELGGMRSHRQFRALVATRLVPKGRGLRQSRYVNLVILWYVGAAQVGVADELSPSAPLHRLRVTPGRVAALYSASTATCQRAPDSRPGRSASGQRAVTFFLGRWAPRSRGRLLRRAGPHWLIRIQRSAYTVDQPSMLRRRVDDRVWTFSRLV
jgi:hypothetical protein